MASPVSTPKRKHSELLNDHVPNLNTITQFTFAQFVPSQVKDGSASPRTSVAHRFRGLAIGSGGGVDGSGGRGSQSPEPKSTRPVFLPMPNETYDGARKRAKLPDVGLRDADSCQPHFAASWDDGGVQMSRPDSQARKPATSGPKSGSQSPRQRSPGSVKFALDTAVVIQSETLANTGRAATASNKTKKTPPIPAERRSSPSASKSHGRVRLATPPPTTRTADDDIADALAETIINDPIRASLTWHDDEITIYDPEDSDDDGTGINGIGFKPTPAIAYARTVKRKQQLAEYRKREEKEARAKRSQRRRGSPVTGLVELKGTVERRRVRFMESATELISF
jgi:hypothetical protein